MDEILITSRMFADYISDEFEIDKKKIVYLPQYAEGIFEKLPIKNENGIFNFMISWI